MEIEEKGRRRKRVDGLSTLEAYLQSTLKPVEPRREFVDSLRIRIMSAPMPKSTAPVVFRFGILAAASIVGSLIIFVAGLRAIVTLWGMVGILRSNRAQIQHKRSTSPQSAL